MLPRIMEYGHVLVLHQYQPLQPTWTQLLPALTSVVVLLQPTCLPCHLIQAQLVPAIQTVLPITLATQLHKTQQLAELVWLRQEQKSAQALVFQTNI